MEIKIRTMDMSFTRQAVTEEGFTLALDAPVLEGGAHRGLTPRQLYLAALGSRISQKLLESLGHRGQEIQGLEMTLQDEDDDAVWNQDRGLHLHLVVQGTAQAEGVKQALAEAQAATVKFASTFQILE